MCAEIPGVIKSAHVGGNKKYNISFSVLPTES